MPIAPLTGRSGIRWIRADPLHSDPHARIAARYQQESWLPSDLTQTGYYPWIALTSVVALSGLVWLYLQMRQRWNQAVQALAGVSAQLLQARSQDPVTGLHNSAWFELQLPQVLGQCGARGEKACVLIVDIDRFQSINDAYGISAGDETLNQVAQLIGRCSQAGQAISRLGGNTFATIVTGDRSHADKVAEALSQALEQPITAASRKVHLTCSMGIAVYPDQATASDIVEKAALAMRSVKARGGAGHGYYDPVADQQRREAALLLQDLHGAVKRRELLLHYQPKVDAKSLQITAAEVLVRWRHPQHGVLGPDKFIPLAERYGLIKQIGQWVIGQACRQASVWREQGLRMRIAVNISATQFQQPDFVDHLSSCLEKYAIAPARFTCEITESVAMQNTEVTRQTFEQLRKLGVHVSIDDFGTGHSSLASLKRLPAAELKIDQAFVTDLATSAHALFIANTIVMMGHELNMRVVAEGVETSEQRDLLVEMGCDELQGYLFSKPIPARELAQWSARDKENDSEIFRASLYAVTKHQALE
jgi:diguanylate cyclase (GGDEF)-like protein